MSKEVLQGKTLYIDYEKCIGCETCEAVCKFLYDLPSLVMARTVDGQVVPISCMHCEQAYCMKVCPRGAIMRDRDNAVILSTMLCRGCETRSCMMACPYAAFFESDKGVGSRKCDLCAKRRQIGLEPACAEMCPCGAISYVERSELDNIATEASRAARDRVLASFKGKKG